MRTTNRNERITASGTKSRRGTKSLAEALYGPAAATKESPLLQIDLQQEESTSRSEAPAAHGEEDLRFELRSAVEHFNRVQADYYAGVEPRIRLNEALCRVGELRNQLGLEPQQKPMLTTFIERPQWRRQMEE